MGSIRKKLIEQVRQRAFTQRKGLYVPRTEGDIRSHWPICQTCKRDVESVNVEDIGTNTVTIRAECHGKEAVIKLEFPYTIIGRSNETVMDHVKTAMNNAVFFDASIA
jgi:hypothetical protein